MSNNTTEALATITVAFGRDGDADFAFKVNDKIEFPTMTDMRIITLAKIIHDLVGGLLGSEALPQINGLIEYQANRQPFEDDE